MTLKMVAVDVDGTISDPEGRIPPCTFRAFERVTSSGGYVAIASGRDEESIAEVLRRNGYRLGEKGYPHALAAADRIFYLREGRYVPDEEWNERAERWWWETQALAEELVDGVLPMLEGYEYERKERGFWFHNLDDALHAQRMLTDYLRSRKVTSLRVERNGWGVGLVDVRVGKGNCLMRIVRKVGLKPEEVVAVGNSHNDASMLDGRMGFFPACPANADEEIIELVRKNGGIVAQQSYGWGVAEIIERLLTAL